jgi:ABC-2 type transport system permease protein
MTDPRAVDRRAAALAEHPMVVVGRGRTLVRGTVDTFHQVWAYRELLGLLVRREIKVRYKDSALGLLWSLLRPLSMLAVYYLVVGRFLGAQRSIPDFAVYIFTGLTAYQLFSEVVSGGTGSILANAGLVKKVSLPREVFPLSVVGSALFNFTVQLSVLVAATVVVGQVPSGSRLLYFPLAAAVLLTWGLALGMALGAVNVYLRDVQYLVEIGLMVLFWSTPTVYSWQLVSDALGPVGEDLYLLNPVAVAVLGFQRAFWVGGDGSLVPEGLAERLGVMLLVGVVAAWGAQRLFARLEGNFAQEL